MKKISLTILRVIYMFGFPVFAHFGGHLIETKIKLFFFAALIIFYLGTFLIEKYFNKTANKEDSLTSLNTSFTKEMEEVVPSISIKI